jgi:SWIM zinc finger
VNTATAWCSCGRYQQDGVPCSHAMAFVFSQGESLERYLPASLSIATWAAQYESPLPPIDISGLKPAYDDVDDNADAISICNPPYTRVPRGRPRKKRMDKATFRASRGVGAGDMLEGDPGARERRAVHCSMCGEAGHYAITCRIPHN